MKPFLKTWAVASAAIVATIGAPASAQVTVGDADGDNCYPFSCGPTDALTEYQQQYNSTEFAGPISFNAIQFTAAPGSLGDPMDTAIYDISFYLSGVPFGALTTDLAANRGTLLGSFSTSPLSGPMPETLTFAGNTINYDPSLGSLLMNVGITGGTTFNRNYNAFFDADYTPGDMARAWSSTAYGPDTSATGALQTTFLTVNSGVPEPSTWAMMLLGFGFVGGAMRSRRRQKLTVSYA